MRHEVGTVSFLVGVFLAACSAPEPSDTEKALPALLAPKVTTNSLVSKGGINPRLLRRFQPLGTPPVANPARVELGHALFFDKRRSRANDMSCNSCHDLARGGASDTPVSRGSASREGERNAPSILHAAGAFASTLARSNHGPIKKTRAACT